MALEQQLSTRDPFNAWGQRDQQPLGQTPPVTQPARQTAHPLAIIGKIMRTGGGTDDLRTRLGISTPTPTPKSTSPLLIEAQRAVRSEKAHGILKRILGK